MMTDSTFTVSNQLNEQAAAPACKLGLRAAAEGLLPLYGIYIQVCAGFSCCAQFLCSTCVCFQTVLCIYPAYIVRMYM